MENGHYSILLKPTLTVVYDTQFQIIKSYLSDYIQLSAWFGKNSKNLLCYKQVLLVLFSGDHTTVDLHLTVLPPKSEAVIFSIDGSFTSSFSVSHHDPKVRPGAVDVVR